MQTCSMSSTSQRMSLSVFRVALALAFLRMADIPLVFFALRDPGVGPMGDRLRDNSLAIDEGITGPWNCCG